MMAKVKTFKVLKGKKATFWLLLASVVLITVNQLVVKSALLGICASIIYLTVGGRLLGIYLFKEEGLIVQISLGALLLLTVISLLGWLFIISYRLGPIETSLILFVSLVFMALLTKFLGREHNLHAEGGS